MEAATVPPPTAQQPPPVETEQAVLVALTLVAMSPDMPEPQMLQLVEGLLAPLGIAATAARTAALLGFGAALLLPSGRQPGPAAAKMARTAPARRAAYVLSSAKRIDRAHSDVPRMEEAAQALEETGDQEAADKLREQATKQSHPELVERRYLAQHLATERARAEAAGRVDLAAAEHGPVLGWRAKMDAATTRACRAAHGHNFAADHPPTLPQLEEGERITGYPGTPHGGACRCVPGPPWPGGQLLE